MSTYSGSGCASTPRRPHDPLGNVPDPREGPVGDLLENIVDRHSWRPAHLHFKIGADQYKPLTTQLYFADDPYLESD